MTQTSVSEPGQSIQHNKQRASARVAPTVSPTTTTTTAADPNDSQPAASPGCNCRVPAEAGREVGLARSLSMAVIAVHFLCLVAYGWTRIVQWLASFCGITAGGVLLFRYQKSAYMCTSFTYIVVAVLDIFAAIVWMRHRQVIQSLLSIVGFGVAIKGSVTGLKASTAWDETSQV